MDIEKKFQEYITQKGLKRTQQRETILRHFLKCTTHVSTEELYLALRKKFPGIGYATVHRTLKLFSESGIAEERNFGDGQTRFELSAGDEHHDHLICSQCGKIIEFEEPMIEQLQSEIAARHNFTIQNHRLELYGLCSDCS